MRASAGVAVMTATFLHKQWAARTKSRRKRNGTDGNHARTNADNGKKLPLTDSERAALNVIMEEVRMAIGLARSRLAPL